MRYFIEVKAIEKYILPESMLSAKRVIHVQRGFFLSRTLCDEDIRFSMGGDNYLYPVQTADAVNCEKCLAILEKHGRAG